MLALVSGYNCGGVKKKDCALLFIIGCLVILVIDGQPIHRQTIYFNHYDI